MNNFEILDAILADLKDPHQLGTNTEKALEKLKLSHVEHEASVAEKLEKMSKPLEK